jgi:hypothetical protein
MTNPTALPCMHTFCRACVDSWRAAQGVHPTCPECKHPMDVMAGVPMAPVAPVAPVVRVRRAVGGQRRRRGGRGRPGHTICTGTNRAHNRPCTFRALRGSRYCGHHGGRRRRRGRDRRPAPDTDQFMLMDVLEHEYGGRVPPSVWTALGFGAPSAPSAPIVVE